MTTSSFLTSFFADMSSILWSISGKCPLFPVMDIRMVTLWYATTTTFITWSREDFRWVFMGDKYFPHRILPTFDIGVRWWRNGSIACQKIAYRIRKSSKVHPWWWSHRSTQMSRAGVNAARVEELIVGNWHITFSDLWATLELYIGMWTGANARAQIVRRRCVKAHAKIGQMYQCIRGRRRTIMILQ
jgi:hypothetical protein